MSEMSILIVEDNNIVAKDIQSRLENLGYSVSGTARTGEEAVEKASALNPALILMDIKLKGDMDGVEAAGLIQDRLSVPIVYLTAYADETTLSRAKITAPFGYIVKPFDENALHTNIEIALFKHSMEKKLKESEQWLATTLTSIGDATIATDAEGFIKFMNPAAEELTHWNEAEVLERNWRDVVEIIDEDDRKFTEPQITQAIRDKAVMSVTEGVLLIDKAGAETPIELTAAPIVDEGDRLLGMVLVFRDTSERKFGEEAQQQKLHLLQAVLEGVSDWIFLKNLEGRYLFINSAGAEILGRPEAEIIGRGDADLFEPETANLMREAHQRVLSTGEKQIFECTLSFDRTERTYLVSEEVCRSSAGETVGVIGIARELTGIQGDRHPFTKGES